MIRSQQSDIAILMEEVDRLRLRTFPSFSHGADYDYDSLDGN